jgi:hypothetical protein
MNLVSCCRVSDDRAKDTRQHRFGTGIARNLNRYIRASLVPAENSPGSQTVPPDGPDTGLTWRTRRGEWTTDEVCVACCQDKLPVPSSGTLLLFV